MKGFEQIALADESEVRALTKHLCDSLNAFLRNRPDFRKIDLLMGLHNFHKIAVLEQREELPDPEFELLCNIAATTFQLAMDSRQDGYSVGGKDKS